MFKLKDDTLVPFLAGARDGLLATVVLFAVFGVCYVLSVETRTMKLLSISAAVLTLIVRSKQWVDNAE